MQRIPTLLQKISELSAKNDKISLIELDLMLDYTKVIYADILEYRNRIAFNNSLAADNPVQTNNSDKAEETKHETPVNQPAPVKEEVLPNTSINNNKDFRNLIGINDKYLFISELFGNNRDDYEAILNEINAFENYIQATNWLNAKTNWDEENETAQLFYGLLNSFFNSK